MTTASAPAARGPVGGFIVSHQTALSAAVGQARDVLVRFPWAPNVVGAASEILLAARAHRRGHHVRAMLHAGNAGYNLAVAAAKANEKSRRDTLDRLGLDSADVYRTRAQRVAARRRRAVRSDNDLG